MRGVLAHVRLDAASLVLVLAVGWLVGHAAALASNQHGLPTFKQGRQQHLQQQQQQPPVCRGLSRRVVDWWVMLKHPGGWQYSYLDSTILGNSSPAAGCVGGSCWHHRLSMLNPNPVAHTLAVLTTHTATATAGGASSHRTAAAAAAAAAAVSSGPLAYVIYNDDDPPGTEHFDAAHAKGVAAFSSSSSNDSFVGFWMVHSAPRFPKPPTEPGFAELARPQSVFGQHFSCFTLAGRQSVDAMAALLLAAVPFVYSSSLPEQLAAEFPVWQQLLSGYNGTQQQFVKATLQTVEGQQLQGFAKAKAWNVSLTDDVVGPGLGSNMLWETWRRSHDALPSRCPHNGTAIQFSSINVLQVAFPGTPYTWHWSQDHSKWGLTVGGSSSSSNNSSSSTVCLGDMNRAFWQSHRGGGYVCLQHVALWEAFHSIVAAAEPCS